MPFVACGLAGRYVTQNSVLIDGRIRGLENVLLVGVGGRWESGAERQNSRIADGDHTPWKRVVIG